LEEFSISNKIIHEEARALRDVNLDFSVRKVNIDVTSVDGLTVTIIEYVANIGAISEWNIGNGVLLVIVRVCQSNEELTS
jgi:hypothetical protein